MTGLHNALARATDHCGCKLPQPPRVDAPHKLSAWAVEDLALDRILADYFKLLPSLTQEVLMTWKHFIDHTCESAIVHAANCCVAINDVLVMALHGLKVEDYQAPSDIDLQVQLPTLALLLSLSKPSRACNLVVTSTPSQQITSIAVVLAGDHLAAAAAV